MDLMHRGIRTFSLLLLLLPVAALMAQGKKSGKEDKSKLTFRLPVDVIVVNATVNDKQGNPVIDLNQSDFKIYEDGKPQTIQTFAMESYEPIPSEDAAKSPASTKGKLRSSEATAPNAGRPRMISMVIDDATMTSFEYYPAIVKALTRFVEQDMGTNDKVAILASSGRVQFPFSNDKQVLLEEINSLLQRLAINSTYKSECPDLTDVQAKRISEGVSESPDMLEAINDTIECANLDDGLSPKSLIIMQARNIARAAAAAQYQEAEYRSRTLLQTLRQHIRSLRHFDAVKSIIVLSNGFLADGASNISFELQEIINQAMASGVVLNTVDVRGLYTPIIPASKRTASTYKQTIYLEEQMARNEPLSRFASDTEGLFFHNNNDIHAGIRGIVHRQASYYVMSYNSPQQKSDGRYRHIKVEVSRSGLELSYRKGYYAPKEELTFERQKKEDILEALRTPDNLNEIPIALAYNYYQEDDARYSVSLSTNVGVGRMQFLDEDSRRKNLIHLVVVAFDETDHYVDGIEKSIDFKLTDSSYASLLTHGINSNVIFHMPQGRYKIKAVVREGAQGKMGSITKAIEIP
jgi:VWFA-related protein